MDGSDDATRGRIDLGAGSGTGEELGCCAGTLDKAGCGSVLLANRYRGWTRLLSRQDFIWYLISKLLGCWGDTPYS